MQYILQMDETLEIIESYQIVIDSETDADFIAANKDLLDNHENADAVMELWYKALDAGFLDDYLDREIIDSTETNYKCDKWGDE